jgi:hypothetical protein
MLAALQNRRDDRKRNAYSRLCAFAASALMVLAVPGGIATAEDTTEPTPAVTMPNTLGASLEIVVQYLRQTTGDMNLVVHTRNVNGKAQYQKVLSNWVVCSQVPKPGTELTPDTWISFGVTRRGTSC